jgi:hypothetical protein
LLGQEGIPRWAMIGTAMRKLGILVVQRKKELQGRSQLSKEVESTNNRWGSTAEGRCVGCLPRGKLGQKRRKRNRNVQKGNIRRRGRVETRGSRLTTGKSRKEGSGRGPKEEIKLVELELEYCVFPICDCGAERYN